MSSLLEDLDDLMWPVSIKFQRKFTPHEYHDFVDWCNDQFGMNGWWHDSTGYICLRKEEYCTLFLLEWM